jgi:hypothetical protein
MQESTETMIELDRLVFSDTSIPAISSAAPVVIRNSPGLSSSDVANASLLRCSDPEISQYCGAQYCSAVSPGDGDGTLLGIRCYCDPDGVLTDPSVASCANSASMSDPVAGVVVTNEDV